MEIIAKDEKKIIEQKVEGTGQFFKVKREEDKKHSLYAQCYLQGINLILNEIVLRKEERLGDTNNIITFIEPFI